VKPLPLFLAIIFFSTALALKAQHSTDTLDPYLKKRIQHLDSTLQRLDEMMDSITGRSKPRLDTLALYRFLMHQKEKNERYRQRWKIGGCIALAVVAAAGVLWWRRTKRQEDNR